MKSRKNIFLLISLMYIIYTIFPLLSDTVSLPVWLPSMASVVFLFVLYPKAFYNTVFYWFLAYAFVLWLYQTMGKPLTIGIGSVQDSKKLLIEYAYFAYNKHFLYTKIFK